MSATYDRTLEFLEHATQHTAEATYGIRISLEQCWRCLAGQAKSTDTGLCEACLNDLRDESERPCP